MLIFTVNYEDWYLECHATNGVKVPNQLLELDTVKFILKSTNLR